jgi:Putative porin
MICPQAGRRSTAVRYAPLLLAVTGVAVAAPADENVLTEVLRRLEALERQNRELALKVETLQRQNEQLQAGAAAAVAPAATMTARVGTPDAPTPSAAQAPEWTSRVQLGGDFRFRHENIDESEPDIDQTRQTIRARFGAKIAFADELDGEIALATGGDDPRGRSATLGGASSRKSIGLDLGYARWRPLAGLAFTAGKMRQPLVRPSLSLFIDNEIRPEGMAVNLERGGLNAAAFGFWLEQRPEASDSMLYGAELGWSGELDPLSLRVGGTYYDFSGIQGRNPGFANSLVSDFGNSITGAGPDARYVFDYDIGELYAEVSLGAGAWPLRAFVAYARNFAAPDGLDTAVSAGVTLGRAREPGRWEATLVTQAMEKDAFFGHWIDSDFAGGFTDNEGQLYRLTWMPVTDLLMNLTYVDSAFNVDQGIRSGYERWQVDFNFVF